jgi:hypothetical protein
MIKTSTTFVIGAGASSAYGLPLGLQLRKDAEQLDARSDIYQLLLTLPFDQGELGLWFEDLKDHPTESIDEFLEYRRTYKNFVSIGKAVIACLVASALLIPRRRDEAEDWLAEVFKAMREGAPTLEAFIEGNRGVKFITFNFDSTIEERLVHNVAALYRVPSDHAAHALSEIAPVFHVHGRLPHPPGQTLRHTPKGFAPEWRPWLLDAAQTINVVSDSLEASVLGNAQRAVAEASIVCFLGFAYNQMNLQRLGVPQTIKTDSYQTVFGSALGLEEGFLHQTRQRFKGQITVGGYQENCVQVLRRFPVFRD